MKYATVYTNLPLEYILIKINPTYYVVITASFHMLKCPSCFFYYFVVYIRSTSVILYSNFFLIFFSYSVRDHD